MFFEREANGSIVQDSDQNLLTQTTVVARIFICSDRRDVHPEMAQPLNWNISK